MNTIGLCMIVKDEAHVIGRCLRSLRDHIDHWVVVDTGSSDGTQELVRELMQGVPGFLLERPWRDFGHNRTEALRAARPHAEYSLVIDADEVLVVPDGFRWPALIADCGFLRIRTGDLLHWRAALLANRLPWRYRGVLHEYPEAKRGKTHRQITEAEVISYADGGRSRGLSPVEKYARDARTLEPALVDEPANARYQTYLAHSYRYSEQFDSALAAYRRRVRLGGCSEDVFASLLWIARLTSQNGAVDDVIAAYQRAWEFRPSRAEPLAGLAHYLLLQGRFGEARSAAAGFADTAPERSRGDRGRRVRLEMPRLLRGRQLRDGRVRRLCRGLSRAARR